MPSTIDWQDFWFDEEGGFDDETIEWLQLRDPSVWHQCAADLNWDWGWKIQGWIVSQPTCSVSTASMLFWMSQPQELIDPEMNASYLSNIGSVHYLAKLIAENNLQNYYGTQQYPVFWNGDFDQRVDRYRDLIGKHPSLKIPWAGMLTCLPKNRVQDRTLLLATEEFVEGIPRSVYGEGI